jgi:hypothetical protein
VTRKVAVGALLVVAAGLVWWAGTMRGEPVEPRLVDAAVEHLVPADGSPNVVRQARIGIDLAPGWTGVLRINGLEVPEDQLDRNEPLNQVFFTPGEGKEIEHLQAGPVVVQALIWRSGFGETRDDARLVTWQFRVA